MKHLFIMNPHSGTGKFVDPLCERINEVCKKRKENYEIHISRYAGDGGLHANQAAKEAEKSGELLRVYACGGDGFLNEILNCIYGIKNVSLACIPCGTGNDFIRNFGSFEDFQDIESQLDGEDISIDLMKYNGKYCINMINIGFDCACVETVEKLKRFKLSTPKSAFYLAVFLCLFRFPKQKLELVFEDGTIINHEFLLLAIGNGKYCGGGFMAASKASLIDGYFDALCVGDVSRKTFLSLVESYKNGTLIGSEKADGIIDFYQERKLSVNSPEPFNISVDGEIVKTKSLDLEIENDAVLFSVPNGLSYNPEM